MQTQRELQDPFRMEDGITWILRNKKYEKFMNYTIKFIAEVSGAQCKDGLWLCVCDKHRGQQEQSSRIILSVSSFDSRDKFISSLREEFPYFSLSGDTKPREISDFYSFLEHLYQTGLTRRCYMITHIGHQENGYWYLSEKLHFKDGRPLPEEEHEYFCKNNNLQQHTVKIQEDLIKSSDNFKKQMKRFLSLCGPSFGVNEHAFLAATAFVLWRLISNADPKERSTENVANIGLIYSQEKSIGKSTALKILAYGQGVSQTDHPLLMSLGDQCQSGTSVKMISKKIGQSTLVGLLDDGCMRSTLEESLLQLQGGLTQGSLKQGNVVPKGSLLLTSNVGESKRLDGRVIKFPFKTPESGLKQVDQALKELFKVVTSNKGLLTLWAIKNAGLFKKAEEKNVLVELAALLFQIFPEQQSRWVKGLAGVIMTQALLCLTTGGKDVLVSIFKEHVSLQSSCRNNVQVQDVLQKVQIAIFNEIKKDPSLSKVLSWLNPLVRVNKGNKTFVDAIGLKNKLICDQWPDVNLQEVKRVMKNVGESTVDVVMPFSTGGTTCSIQDLRSRSKEKVQQQKGVKIPRAKLNENLVRLIDLVARSDKESLPEDARGLLSSESPIPGEIESTASSGPQLDEAFLQQLKTVEKMLQEIIMPEHTSEGSSTPASETSSSESSPSSTRATNTPWIRRNTRSATKRKRALFSSRDEKEPHQDTQAVGGTSQPKRRRYSRRSKRI